MAFGLYLYLIDNSFKAKRAALTGSITPFSFFVFQMRLDYIDKLKNNRYKYTYLNKLKKYQFGGNITFPSESVTIEMMFHFVL